MKKTKHIISTILLFWWFLPFISFWQNQEQPPCATCSSSPVHITLINNFTTEVLASIKTIGTEWSYAGKHVPPSWFNSGKFVPPKQGIMSKTLRRAKETLWSTLAIKRIHIEVSDFVNIGDSLSVLAGNKTILRDRQKMGKTEQDINRKKYELSVGDGRTDKISWVPLRELQKTIEKYQDLGILSTATKIDDGAEYGDLILLLGRMNASVKHLIAVGGTGWASSEKQKVIDLRTSWEVAIQLKSEAINQIQEDYACTRRYACEQSRTSLKEEMKKIKNAFKDGIKNIWTEISQANQRLMEVYSQKRTNSLFKVKKDFSAINELSWALKNLKNRRGKENEIPPTTTVENNDTIASSITTTADKQAIINSFLQRIQDTKKTIQQEHQEINKKYTTTDISDIMPYFVSLSQKINEITDNGIGNKDTDKNCLIKNLWALCEKQCSNIGNKSCYY